MRFSFCSQLGDMPSHRNSNRRTAVYGIICANHYKTTVQILRPTMGYKQKTADFRICGEDYELKTPLSAKAEKVEWLIREATKQSSAVIVDMRKTRILESRMAEICRDRLQHIKKLEKIVLIVNKKKVIEFKKQ